MIDVIYLMGGVGKRAKLGYPKQFVYLGGKQLFLHGLETISKIPDVSNVIIVASDIVKTYKSLNLNFGHKDDNYNLYDRADSIAAPNYFGKNKELILVKNGETRQDSVKKGLEYVKTEFVLISEAVRPFITTKLTKTVIETSGDVVTPVSNMKSTGIYKLICSTADRDSLGEVQMPQKIKISTLNKAYEKNYANILYTDSCDLIYSILYKKITIVDGIEENIKITTPLDIELAKAIYEYKKVGSYE